MIRNKIPRKLKKQIVKELGRDSYKVYMSDDNFKFVKDITVWMGKAGWEYEDLGGYKLMYKIDDGENN